MVEISVVGQVGVPETVVKRAIEKQEELRKLASRRSADSFTKNFHVWAVFDRDEHPLFVESIERGIRNNIQIAYSNPCVELWAILHLDELGTSEIGRRDLQRQLQSLMPGYSHDRYPYFQFDMMVAQYASARSRAQYLEREINERQVNYGCPSTSIYRLTDLILTTARPPPDRHEKAKELRIKLGEIEANEMFQQGDRRLVREREELYLLLKSLE